MTTPPVRVERRAGQRFPYLLPLSLSQCEGSLQGVGFTQDLSSRGVFFFTDAALEEGAEIDITLRMPSEITLGESMRVRCRGHVLRVVKPVPSGLDASGLPRADAKITEAKIGVAVRLECYEYLSDGDDAATFPRVSALHEHDHDAPCDEERPLADAALRPELG